MNWIKNKQKLDKRDWHLHFVWKPVVVHTYPDGNEKKVWLTTVLRRKNVNQRALRMGFLSYDVEYKEIPTGKPKPFLKMSPERRRELIKAEPDVFPIPFRTDTLCVSGVYEPWKYPEPEVGLFNKIEHPCKECEYGDDGGESCMECSEVDEPDLCKPEAMKEAFRVTMTPWKPKHDWKDCNGCEDCIEGWTEPEDEQRHEIDIAWEVKSARRNKTIM